MKSNFVFTMLSLVLFVGCGMGECQPNPDRGQCALQTCGDTEYGNFQENYECRGPNDERWGWECGQYGSQNIRCETFE